MTADFDRVGDQFVDYYQTARGHVREVLTRENLVPYLPPPPATVLDIGGGDGRDAKWLAEQGYEVTLVDPSVEMIKKAKARFRKKGLTVVVKQLSPEEITEKLPANSFEVVLSHGVLMYCADNPQDHLKTVHQLAVPGALISILTKGFGGALSRALYQKETKNVETLLSKEICINNLGLRVLALRPETMESWLVKHQFNLLNWRGVRIVTDQDRRNLLEVSEAEREQIMEVERLLGQEESTRGLGQMLHYIARKP